MFKWVGLRPAGLKRQVANLAHGRGSPPTPRGPSTMSVLPLLFLTAALAETGHEQANPLYRELREKGVDVGNGVKVPLPAPTMADGLDAQAQQAVIKGRGIVSS